MCFAPQRVHVARRDRIRDASDAVAQVRDVQVHQLAGLDRADTGGEGADDRRVDDLIDGFVRLMATPDSITGPINIGNPGEFTIAELADDKAFTSANLKALRNCTLINMIDGCAISLPCQREGEAPVGLMLAGLNGTDHRLFQLASGMEALIRWHHPRRGLVMPGEFIGLCEEAGLIHALGATVLEQAARQQVQWARRGYPLRVSVYLSPKQFGDPDLLRTIETIVRKTGCNPQLMELEITESVLLGHDEATINTLHALCDMGFRLAIDDFGTGYSNLAYLQLYPINCLKIDRSFVQALGTATPIADLIITMCGMLQMDMVAEGVETEAQLAWLRDRHCHEYQGFLFSKAVPVSEFDALLTRQTQRSPGR